MNGTTRCPLCDTRFKISEAQLTAHRGMVRCGHCHGAFDARIDFIAAQPAALESEHIEEPQTAARTEPHEVSDAHPDVEPQVLRHDEKPHDSAELADFLADSAESVTPPPEPEPASAPVPELAPEPEPEAEEPVAEPETLPPAPEITGTPLLEHAAEQPPAAEIRHIVSLDDVSPPASPIAEGVGAMPEKRSTWPWLIGVGFGMLLLGAQSVYFLRVELAAQLPALKPALTGICSALGCKVALPKDIDAISIESSGLDADPEHDNLITLNALLRNRAGTVQGYPMLVLTLNDNHDKLLARRWLTPAEYLPSGESEAAGFAANHETSVSLHLDTADMKPSGYRLELFYGRN